MQKLRILVVDDDRLFRESVVEMLHRQGYELESAVNGAEGLEKFQDGDFDLVISDFKMPGMSGLEFLEKIKQCDPEIPFIMITGHGAIDVAVEAMRKGAYHFIEKDGDARKIELTVESAIQFRNLVVENKSLRSALQEKWNYIGEAKSMADIRKLVESVATSRSTVLVSGESGTGKELIARSIHYQSPRQHGPFIKVNCAALPEGLIESELFGHEKGAFTGAFKRKLGKFELASGGTLLMDEIGEMSSNVQAKLLRVLQEREVSKVGGDQPVEVNVRVIATTNRNLDREVSSGAFREDLYYRLNVFHIHLPPLRERKEDIPKLAEHFILKYNEENGFNVEGIDDKCLPLMNSYDWPGNIRELENTIERAVVLTRTGKILPDMITLKAPAKNQPDGSAALQAGITIAQVEKDLILKTLEHCGQNRTKAAQMLDISIRTLRNKLHEYGQDNGESE
jgi:DNA-binding NtrC family response regulator